MINNGPFTTRPVEVDEEESATTGSKYFELKCQYVPFSYTFSAPPRLASFTCTNCHLLFGIFLRGFDH